MNARCSGKYEVYAKYTRGGITVTPEWRSFEQFRADMGERPAGMTLDRKDGTKGYSKDNCRWATRTQQQNNLKTNHCVTFKDVTLTLAQWGAVLGIRPGAIRHRLTNGWSPEKALTTPVRPRWEHQTS